MKALDDVNFAVREQEFVAIIGKSGSGKKYTLHMIGGLDTPTSGESIWGIRRLGSLAKNSLPFFAEEKWDLYSRIIIWCRILMSMKNVVLPVELDGKRIDREFVDEILELLKLMKSGKHFPIHYPAGSSREWQSQGQLPQSRVSF